MRAPSIAVLEKGKPRQHLFRRNAIETRKHPAAAQDADIIERRFDGGEHLAHCDSYLVQNVTPYKTDFKELEKWAAP